MPAAQLFSPYTSRPSAPRQRRPRLPAAKTTKAREHVRRHSHLEDHRAGAAAPPLHAGGSSAARFGGFGPVAKRLFPDEVLLHKNPDHEFRGYKDASWQALGEELNGLLTQAEYDSAKRTTFNAFYTSPTVISATCTKRSPASASPRVPSC